jgi:hypothetical protein
MRKPVRHIRRHRYQVIVAAGVDPITKRYRYQYEQTDPPGPDEAVRLLSAAESHSRVMAVLTWMVLAAARRGGKGTVVPSCQAGLARRYSGRWRADRRCGTWSASGGGRMMVWPRG